MASGLTETSSNLHTMKRLFTEARDMTQTARQTATKHRRYYDGKIDEQLKRQLRAKKQPDFTINRVRPGVEGMVGVVERGKSDPRAYPRTPQDEGSAEVATDSLRYVADTNRWHQTKIACFRNMLIESTAAVLVEVDDQLEVRTRKIRFEEFFADPYSRELDFSDASYMGMAKWMYLDTVAAAYPDQAEALKASCETGSTGDAAWDDRPGNVTTTTWVDKARRRLLVVEIYHRQSGTWTKCVFVGDLVLEEGASPYLDSDGKPCCPIEANSAYIDDENNRYGVVADMIGPQDEINVYRRKAAHLATFRQLQETDPVAAYADPEEARREAAKPDGVIPPGYGIVPNDKFNMDMALLNEAKSEIERAGVNPAILGRQGENQSGRASLIRQQAGMTELAHLFGGLEDWELRVYRQIWARIRQFWTEPKFIRVTDDENAVKFIQINEPIWGPPAPVMDPLTNLPQYDPHTRQIVMQPQFLGMKNAVAEMGVDIIVDSTPDTANVAQEQFQALADLARAGVPIPPAALIKASSLPKKREILEAMEQGQQQPPQPTPEQLEAVRLELAAKAADIGKTEAQAQQARATAAKTVTDIRATEMQTRWMDGALPPPMGF